MTWFERLRRAVAGDAEGSAIVAASAHVPDLSRRRFLGLALGAAAVAATIDVEQLLWTPSKTFLLPSEPAWQTFTITDHVWSDAELDFSEKYIRPAAQHLADEIDQMYLRAFENSVAITRKYADNFDRFKIGDTIQIRLPRRYVHNVAEKRLNARRVA
jgi:hypothetical protein